MDWTLTDWSQGTAGLDRLAAKRRRVQAAIAAVLLVGGVVDLVISRTVGRADFFERLLIDISPGLAVMLAVCLARLSSRADSKNQAGILLDLPDLVPQYPVTVSYRMGNQEYGLDRGVMMFANGMMVFQGVRSRFTFGGSLRLPVVTSLGLPAVCYVVDEASYSVRISPDANFAGVRSDTSQFFREFHKWGSWRRGGANDKIAPPLSPHRDSVSESGLSAIIPGSMAFWMFWWAQAGSRWNKFENPLGNEWIYSAVLACVAGIAALACVRATVWFKLRQRMRSHTPGYGGVSLTRDEALLPGTGIHTVVLEEPEQLHQRH